MKHKTPGVTDELLTKAEEEFLKEGYRGASLRKIALSAGVSTNSIYVRFSGKEGLFDAIVKETAEEFLNMLSDMNRLTETEDNTETAMEASDRYTMETLDYVYDHLNIFKLIFLKAEGTGYEDYLDRLSEQEEKAYRYYVERLGKRDKVSDLFIHVVCQTSYRYLAETLSYNLNREEARSFMREVLTYTDAGFMAVIGQ